VARYAPEHRAEKIAEEALAVGFKAKAQDPYKVVGSASWPIRALVERGRVERLGPIIESLLFLSSHIQSSASRSEALFLLFHAVFPAGRSSWQSVFKALSAASQPVVHWRQGRNLRDAVLLIASEELEYASELCRGIDDPKLRGQIERKLIKAEYATPRPFFWTS
jgi:hypothetical protein